MAEWVFEKIALVKKVKRWRWVTFFATLIAISALYMNHSMRSVSVSDHIARIEIHGVITGDEDTLKLIRKVQNNPQVKAVIVAIDSPGGTVTGSEILYEALRDLNKVKPLTTLIETVGASGGYIAAIASDHIIARQTSIVGSIGVIFQFPNLSKLMETVGVKVEEIKSAPLKAAPNGLDAPTPEARQAVAALVKESFTWFKDMVKLRRNMDDAQLAVVSDGRVFLGKQAISLKLIDAIGGDDQALDYFKGKNITGLKIVKHDKAVKSKGFVKDILSGYLPITLLDNNSFTHNGLMAMWKF
jgi:protease IV